MPTSIGTRIDHTQQVPGTWAGGTTHKIYAYPSDPDQTIASAQFWFGTAVIQQNAAYSFFPDRIRIQIPIQGNGIRLHFQDPAETIILNTNAAYRFDGARPVQVELVEGPIIALNIIFRSDVHTEAYIVRFDQQQYSLTDLVRLTQHKETQTNQTMLQIVYVVTGSLNLHIAHDSAVDLHSGDAFVVYPHSVAERTPPPILLERRESPTQLIIATAWAPTVQT